MIIKLLPEQLVKVWDSIRFAIAETFVPRERCTNEHLRHILSRLLSGRSQCWAILDSNKTFLGFLITRIAIDDVTGERVLNMDHIYAYAPLSNEVWEAGFKILCKFALKNSCKAFVSFTDNPRIEERARYFDSTIRTMIVKEL